MKSRAIIIAAVLSVAAPAFAGGKDVVRDYFEASFEYDIATLQGLVADDFRGLPPSKDVGVDMDGMSRAEYFKTLEYARKGRTNEPDTDYEIVSIDKESDKAYRVTVIQTMDRDGETHRQKTVSRATVEGDEITTLQLMSIENL